jgi:MoxR-like ATPase
VFVDYPSPEQLSQIIRQTTTAEVTQAKAVLEPDKAQSWILRARHLVREVMVSSAIEDYIVRLVTATRPRAESPDHPATKFLRYGASPRGAQAILLGAKVLALVNGRVNVSFDDVDRLVIPALSHRLVLSFEAEADRRSTQEVLKAIVEPLRQAR